jgi:hypothetical protein
MRKLLVLITAIFALFIVETPAVMGLTVQIGYPGSNYGMYQTGQGGEFTLVPIGWGVTGMYYSGASNIGATGSFQTFCLEGLETISPYPSQYDAVLSNNAVYGGTGQGDPLSKGAAWLYYEFATGGNFENRAIYYYNSGRSTSAALMQNAIWWLEGEKSIPYSATNPFMTAVVGKFGNAAAAMDINNEYAVMVLNLWDKNHIGEYGHQHQDQLVLVPEPLTLLLLGLGLMGVAGIRRRFKK